MSRPIAEVPTFTESTPIELWSAELTGTEAYSHFERVVCDVAENNGQAYSGYIVRDEDLVVRSFTRTRYPRKKYGIIPAAECQDGMNDLANALSWTLQPDAQRAGVRVVLGLLEGYDAASQTHSMSEVSTILGNAVVATEATVFAVRQSSAGVLVYTEPVAVVRGEASALPAIYHLADAFKQERFTVENFDTQTAYLLETRFCTQPD